jgi:hypothetical protein
MIARWKGIIEEIHFGGSIMFLAIIEKLDPEKLSFKQVMLPTTRILFAKPTQIKYQRL